MNALTNVPDPTARSDADDPGWARNQIVDAGAVIIRSPIINRSIPGALKLLIDRVLGPKTYVVFAARHFEVPVSLSA